MCSVSEVKLQKHVSQLSTYDHIIYHCGFTWSLLETCCNLSIMVCLIDSNDSYVHDSLSHTCYLASYKTIIS